MSRQQRGKADRTSADNLQATQAGNQLVGVQTRQPADLTALLAAQGRSQALEQARKAEAEGARLRSSSAVF